MTLRHELDYAKAMAVGEIASPFRYENVWLFNIRITGTGYAYRGSLDEHVYRPPENYLTSEFLERCNGLPVIYEHPENGHKGCPLLDADQFSSRIIGTVVYPYVSGEDVNGIAKIWDDEGAELMCTTHKSTSPGVNFANKEGVQKVTLAQGETIVVEGTPSLFDHVAICELGVWDKGGDPSGVKLGEVIMPDIEENLQAENKAKADADEKARCDREARMDAMMARMDAMFAKMDADKMETETKVDSEKEEEKEKAKVDAETAKEAAYADMQRELAELKRSMPRDLTDEDRNAIAAAQSRADSVFAALGKNLPHPMMGEMPLAFKRRLAGILQPLSSAWSGIDLKSMPDKAFANAEEAIYADAQKFALAPTDVPAGQLRERRTESAAGHRITEYSGCPSVWMDQFAPPVKHLARFPLQTKRA